jgi:pimeloyl-ACP methyl ester carboxylesterase
MTVQERIFHATSADGTRIGCVLDGAGPPLVLVHGTGDTHGGFRRIRPLLARHFTLYLMDRRGRGVSSDQDAYSLDREFEDVAAVIDAVAEPVNLFAHSFGAMCALEGALRARNLRRLCCYEPSTNRLMSDRTRESTIDEMCRLIAEGDRDGVVTIHLRNIIHTADEVIERHRAQTAAWAARLAMAHTMPRELHALRSHPFEPERYASLRVPVRFLLGEKTVGRGPETARRLVEAIPGAELVVLLGQGHFGYITVPELVTEKLIEFFS